MMHPLTAVGWTHIWDGETQTAIDDKLAAFLVLAGAIEYSPEDGPNAKVYRPLIPSEQILRMLVI